MKRKRPKEITSVKASEPAVSTADAEGHSVRLKIIIKYIAILPTDMFRGFFLDSFGIINFE